ncbi:MAG: thiamine phosphate synthase [Betaproteobacteria bacterium]|nr:thiamine phosphate synthase [Betaproteobacteria bacterium]
MQRRLRGLYAITPDAGDSAALFAKVSAALEGGIALLQYRRKTTEAEMRRVEAIELAKLCRQRGVPFIVNDDARLAAEAGADGVHVGRDDDSVSGCRRTLPGKIVGASCYDRMELAEAAVRQGADYVAFGSVFASPTKPAAVRAPLELLAQARRLGVPVAAIGGITLDNAPQAIAAGADLLAVLSDLFDAPDIAQRARQYVKLFA